MNHKHVQVIIEDHDYSGLFSTQGIINDLIHYIECVEAGRLEEHYENCIVDRSEGETHA